MLLMDILNKIFNDQLKNKNINHTLATIRWEELGLLHFSVGMYIRNKYIWNNSQNFKVLSKIYNTCDTDKISRLIINDVFCLIHKK